MTDDSFSGLATGGVRDLGPGSRLGTYVLEQPLGRGGMGQVWKATDGKRPVAIKLLPPEFRGNVSAMAQVGEAFQVVHALTHEHICKTLGLFDDPVHGPYLVLDFIAGITLSEYQRTGGFPKGRMSPERVGEILRPVARALDYSHRKVIQLANGIEHKGVLHRDVKPDNILLVLRENHIREVWLIDFGLASEIRNTMTKHTNKSVDTRGTRPYMSPEQIRGKRHQWDGRTDQYSLAVVAYQLLAGHLPFDGDDEFSLMLAITQESADPIPGVPDHVNAAVLKGLSKKQEERFASCQELAEALCAEFVTTLATPGIVVPKSVTPAAPPPLLVAPFDAPAAQAAQQAWAKSLGQPVERTNSLGMKFALIPPGNFKMGSPKSEADRGDDEGPQHTVRISQPFYAGVYEVTQSEYDQIMGLNPSHFETVSGQNANRFPVESVSWFDAVEFCNRLSERDGNSPYYGITGIERDAGSIQNAGVSVLGGNGYRLPSEAEWEYACRAGTTTPYHFGNVLNGDRANVDGNDPYGTAQKGPYLQRTATVGSYAKNAFGLFDMHGNVWEWCEDVYDAKVYGQRSGTTSDPIVTSGSSRVLRGGSWYLYAFDARCSSRYSNAPAYRRDFIGFRVMVSL